VEIHRLLDRIVMSVSKVQQQGAPHPGCEVQGCLGQSRIDGRQPVAASVAVDGCQRGERRVVRSELQTGCGTVGQVCEGVGVERLRALERLDGPSPRSSEGPLLRWPLECRC